jgi:hypothetical protein
MIEKLSTFPIRQIALSCFAHLPQCMQMNADNPMPLPLVCPVRLPRRAILSFLIPRRSKGLPFCADERPG